MMRCPCLPASSSKKATGRRPKCLLFLSTLATTRPVVPAPRMTTGEMPIFLRNMASLTSQRKKTMPKKSGGRLPKTSAALSRMFPFGEAPKAAASGGNSRK